MIFGKFRSRLMAMSAITASVFAATPAQAEWWEAETAHFVVKSRASESEAREYALELERFDAALRALQGMDPIGDNTSRSNKPTVYRYGRPKDMARAIGYPGSGIAGFFMPRAGSSVGFAPVHNTRDTSAKTSWQLRDDSRTEMTPRTVLLHEYTHYFMMQHFPGAYPRWYVEGFAETMATMRFEEDGSYHIGDPPQHRSDQIFKLKDFPLDEMLDANHKLSGLDGLQHYATGWLLTHYMSFDGERLMKLRAYLAAIADGEDSLAAARKHFGDLDELERELGRYKKGPLPGINLSGTVAAESVKMRELTDAEEEAIFAEIRLARGISDKGEARDVLGDLEKIIAKNGASEHLLELLGDAQLSIEDYAAADATGERLIELSNDNPMGWLLRAVAAAEQVKEEPGAGERARRFAAEAASRDRDDPRPLMLYYYSYYEAGEEIPETAIIALEQAFENAGSDTGYRLLLARQLILEDRLPSARAVLMPIAFSGHRTAEPSNEEDPTLSRILKLVLDGQRDEALAMVDKMLADKDEESDG